MRRSPEVMRAWETNPDDVTYKCDGCGNSLHADAPVLLVGTIAMVCRPCVEWAMPQLEALAIAP